jgi:hypothetical protein
VERVVARVFELHTRTAAAAAAAGADCGAQTRRDAFDSGRSGAEFWTQVLDEDDEIGMHWDKDYALEHAEPGLNVHPHIATVTYLSSLGAPTLVLRKPTPVFFEESVAGDLEKFASSRPGDAPPHASASAFLSYPAIGKHVAFDGRWLHGALPELKAREGEVKTAKGGSPRTESSRKKRVTLLVNVWLNHVPSTATPLDVDHESLAPRGLASLGKYGVERNAGETNATNDEEMLESSVESIDVSEREGGLKTIRREFLHAGKKFAVSVSVPKEWRGAGPGGGRSFALVGSTGSVEHSGGGSKSDARGKRKRKGDPLGAAPVQTPRARF